jgi:hypothetical protein
LLVGIAPAPPGNMQPQPIVRSEKPDSLEVQLMEGAAVMTLQRGRPSAPAPAFVDAKLIGTGDRFPRETREAYISSLHALPHRLLIERMNLHGKALRLNSLDALTGKRIVMLNGTHDLDHPDAFERTVCDWLNANGASAEHISLGDRGIAGNGHMLMLERNSSAIADLIAERVTALLS